MYLIVEGINEILGAEWILEQMITIIQSHIFSKPIIRLISKVTHNM